MSAIDRPENDAAAAIRTLRESRGDDAAGSDDRTNHVFLLIDESGSMKHLQETVVSSCNEFIADFADNPSVRMWLAWFDKCPGEQRVRIKVPGVPASEVTKLVASDYTPRGQTPLNDAIVEAIATLDDATDDNDVVFLVIITDGYENASETSLETVKQLVTQREEAGWGIVFLGADQDAVAAAASIGLDREGTAFNFDAERRSLSMSMRGVADLAHIRTRFGAGPAERERYDAAAQQRFKRGSGRLDRE